MPCRSPNSCSIGAFCGGLPLSLAFAATVLIASIVQAPAAHAQIVATICLDRHSNPAECPHDDRPPVGGVEAERNLEHAQGVERDNRRRDTKVIDYRNGRFRIFSRPTWHDGYCTTFVQASGEASALNHYEHHRVSEAVCGQEALRFSRADTRTPFADARGDLLLCTSSYAQACADDLRLVRNTAEQADDEARVSFGHEPRDRASEVARFRSLTTSNGLVVQRIDRSGDCVRAAGSGFLTVDDGQSVTVCRGSEGRRSRAWVFYEGAITY